MIKKILNRIKLKSFYIFLNTRFYFLNKKNQMYNSYEDFVNFGFYKYSCSGLSYDIQKSFDGKDFKKLSKQSSKLYKILSKTEKGYKGLAVSLKNDFLWEHIFTDNLFNLLKSYYKTEKFFIRNSPVITYFYEGDENGAQTYHVDHGQRQLSLMVNLNDLDKDFTHMVYIAKSNKINHYHHQN